MTLVQNDTGIVFNFNVKDENNLNVDLTNATVRLIWLNDAGKSVKTCAVVDAANGMCRYVVASGDLAAVGKYDCELEVDFGATRLTTNKFSFKVRSEL
ncbi:MAG: phage baseplate upper protein [Peptococcaceae bacterium]|nr:phage baseplate upper protein [Peptococcaceae bacterium]